MQGISASQCLEWLRNHGYVNSDDAKPDDIFGSQMLSDFQFIEAPFPKDSGRKVVLAKFAVRQFPPDQSLLVWIGNWMIWPSSGYLPLLLRWRQALGESRPLEEIPGHLFSNSEREDAISLLILGIEFYWDVLIVEPTGKRAFFFSHDEFLRALAKDGDVLKKINESLIAAKFKTP